MNQPIRCEPLPLLKTNGEAAAEAPLCTESNSGNTADFGQLLNAELGETPLDSDTMSEAQSGKETEALAAYGVASLLVQIVPQQIPISVGQNTSNHPLNSSPLSLGGEGQGEGVMTPETLSNLARPGQSTPLESQPAPQAVTHLNLQPVPEAAEQKLPGTPKETPTFPEQISGKPSEPAKKTSGIVVAQPPLMLMTSQQEKSALQPGRSLALEHFQAPSVNQAIRIQLPASETRRSDRAETFNLGAVEADLLQTPRFEVVSGEIDLQPVRPVEPIAVVEQIRAHIELLKASTAEKLDVVIRPDAQTELNIQVEKVNGHIHVQVRCDRGDFAALETQWGTIQSTLATQGIRVDPLQQGPGAQLQQQGSHNSHNFSGQHSNQHDERPAVLIEQEFTNREGTRPKTARGSVGRGWQSWA